MTFILGGFQTDFARNVARDGARRFATLNIGGSATTACAFVVGRGA